MLAIILALLTSFAHSDLPAAQVETGASEAVFVPAGFVGPIVAAPFNEIVF